MKFSKNKFQKRIKFDYYLRFPFYFVFWKEELQTLFVLHIKEMWIKCFKSSHGRISIKKVILKVYRKTPGVSFGWNGRSKAWNVRLQHSCFAMNFENIFCIKHHWVAASECLYSSKYASFSVFSRRVKCRRFYNEFISTLSIKRREFLKDLIESFY